MNTYLKFGRILLLFVALMTNVTLYAQSVQKVSVGFYNLENLFDTIDTPDVRDSEFTPSSEKGWNTQKYNEKIGNMAKAISGIATDIMPDGLAVIGVCEVENIGVLQDLVKHPLLKDRNYQIVHYNSPDRRGIDVALLYQPKYFQLENSLHIPLTREDDFGFRTRDQLLVTGELEGEKVHFLVNHWPSRSDGEERSRPLRNAAGDLSRSIVDFVLGLDPKAKIMVMGDLNDDPSNASVMEHFKASGDKALVPEGYFYNPFALLHKPDTYGSLAYRGKWNLFDQIMVSPALVKSKRKRWHITDASVYNAAFLKNTDGKYKGFPFRTYAGNHYLGGYSDHLPVYIILEK